MGGPRPHPARTILTRLFRPESTRNHAPRGGTLSIGLAAHRNLTAKISQQELRPPIR